MQIIGIAGGSGSGKSTVVCQIIKRLPKESVAIISQDSYYRDNGFLTQEEKLKINFDHPSAIEFNLLIKHLEILKTGQTIEMPIYDYVSCARSKETIPVFPKPVVIVEGILIMTDILLREQMDLRVFVDADADVRLMRIIRRDTEERGRTFQQVLKHYETYVKPMHEEFIEPTKRYADIIFPRGGHNLLAINTLTSHIKSHLSY